jgi:hypothetical protein
MAKLFVAKPKANTDSTSYFIDVVCGGRLWYKALGEESVVASTQSKDGKKETTGLISKYSGV